MLAFYQQPVGRQLVAEALLSLLSQRDRPTPPSGLSFAWSRSSAAGTASVPATYAHGEADERIEWRSAAPYRRRRDVQVRPRVTEAAHGTVGSRCRGPLQGRLLTRQNSRESHPSACRDWERCRWPRTAKDPGPPCVPGSCRRAYRRRSSVVRCAAHPRGRSDLTVVAPLWFLHRGLVPVAQQADPPPEAVLAPTELGEPVCVVPAPRPGRSGPGMAGDGCTAPCPAPSPPLPLPLRLPHPPAQHSRDDVPRLREGSGARVPPYGVLHPLPDGLLVLALITPFPPWPPLRVRGRRARRVKAGNTTEPRILGSGALTRSDRLRERPAAGRRRPCDCGAP